MGHERIGILPRSHNWNKIRDALLQFNSDFNNTTQIAKITIQNVRNRFSNLINDSASTAVIDFLLELSNHYNVGDKKDVNINVPINPSPLQLLKIYESTTNIQYSSREYESIIKDSFARALVKYYNTHKPEQTNLFQVQNPRDFVWGNLTNAKGFCELSRYYYSNLTENYLKYFLDREASAIVQNISERETLSNSIYIHSFETARIVQSFAAGWFNKNAKNKKPSQAAIKKFTSYIATKIKAELLREEELL